VQRAQHVGYSYFGRPQSPVIPWYQAEIAFLRRRIESLAVNRIAQQQTRPALDLLAHPVAETAPVALNVPSEPRPTTDVPTFGIEIECIMPQSMTHSRLAGLLSQVDGIQASAEMYNHQSRDYWKIVTDGSLGDYSRGAELVSPILRGEEGFEQVRKVCGILNANNVKVNRRCGFHVHVGARDRGVSFFRSLLMLYAHYEPVLDTLVSPSRRASGNTYCRSTKVLVDGRRQEIESAVDIDGLTNAYSRSGRNDRGGDHGRLVKLNLAAYWRHGTVEFRHHQGTVNAEKAETWIRLCIALVEAAGAGVEPGEETIDALAEKVGMVETLPYWRRRQLELSHIQVTERT
jgi:hypothetical protein